MDEKKVCSMIEACPDLEHSVGKEDLQFVCSECGRKITATAEFGVFERLEKVSYPLCYCPNCNADIKEFVVKAV